MSTTTLKINTEVRATIQKVWNCYNLSEHITKWNFASLDWCCPFAENNLVVGGKLKSRMEAKDGSFGFEATYTEIVEYALIAYTLSDGRKVKTTFTNNNGIVEIEIGFEAENQNSLDMQQAGWQAILTHFKNYTENTP
ncbi:MAG TPA: SRPBCC domain-containing protein [Chitinophagales bacterium]|jgi:uncharacterized protein YndB with AHSA1/START domain|nr:SRPBCC domain-containing protein [Chitinophagales bacterium]MBP6154152.1 SRPBCC domain-containing protein [Chitinophagales bacterium]HQV77230.1 SRPBCC domain-containing protein [Chitinophagales bacterium]HQW79729.1 SRPBCC domain-containing protein [Chitinophagales bacterium]HRB18746.1 SRPBCC domain-containing protein [Chitinophagales bacterium]